LAIVVSKAFCYGILTLLTSAYLASVKKYTSEVGIPFVWDSVSFKLKFGGD
jgi:hypothetical protein